MKEDGGGKWQKEDGRRRKAEGEGEGGRQDEGGRREE